MPLRLSSQMVPAALPLAVSTLTSTLWPVSVQLLFILQLQPCVCPQGVLTPLPALNPLVLLSECLSLDTALTVDTSVLLLLHF